MNPIVIDIQNLSKKYRLGGHFQLDQTLPEMVSAKTKALWQRLCGNAPKVQTPSEMSKDFMALDGVDMQIRQGEVVGIIGRNGAGKSTLLKILSQITDPSDGQARIRGRVASLLEVGTGFHPELTGRENIYLNGSILGMTRKEIDANFDNIVEYSGIEKFIDTPVKRYSSGMSVRLAFSIAAHLEPEILIIDEVLAVGDAAFQHRCIGRMQEAAGSGRTVLFVSHNMAAVQTLCTRAILLQDGKVVADGKPDEVIPLYLNDHNKKTAALNDRSDRTGTEEARLLKCEVTGLDGGDIEVGKPWQLRVKYKTNFPNLRHDIGFCIAAADNPRASFLATNMLKEVPQCWPAIGEVIIESEQPCMLWPGTYSLDLAIHREGRVCDYVRDAVSFDVSLGSQTVFQSMGRRPATMLLPAEVKIHPVNEISVFPSLEQAA